MQRLGYDRLMSRLQRLRYEQLTVQFRGQGSPSQKQAPTDGPVEARSIETNGVLSMHTQGTAVLDRPAEVTVPAQALLPVLDISADALDLEPVKSTDDAAKALASRHDDVRDLTYGELAVALNASGTRPYHFRSADTAQLMQWAAQGLALLGIDRIRHYVRRTRHINTLFIDECLSADTLAEYARMWHSHKTAQ